MEQENVNYNITPEQEKICKQLQRLITKAESAGVMLWDNYGTLTALNGNVIID